MTVKDSETGAARPQILVANRAGLHLFNRADIATLGEVGDILNDEPIGDWDAEGVDELLAKATVIVGHWGCPYIDVALLDRAPNLGLIAYAAGTVKTLIAPEVFDRVRVTSGADANAEPVAEFTLAMILLANKDVLWRRDVERDADLDGQRQMPEFRFGNWDKTVGVIGASIIGRRVIELLQPFPTLRPVVYDPFVTAEEAAELGAEKVELVELCARSEVVSIHAPALESTRHMIGEPQLAAMRAGATLINTARGSLLDHDALVAHVDRLNVILDVTDPEPLPADHPLRSAPTVSITPHVAGSQGTELRRMAHYAADEVQRWATGQPSRNPITSDMLGRIA